MVREGTPEVVQPPLVPTGDKGKEVVQDPPPLAKRQRTIPPVEPRQAASVEEPVRLVINLHHRLAIQGAAGPVEIATASAIVSRVVHSLNAMGGDL